MGTAGRIKTQFMALVDTRQLDRLDALRVVTGESRAEINRKALDGTSLKDQEMVHSEALVRLTRLAQKVGMTVPEFVRSLVEGRRAGVPTLAELEAMKREDLDAQLAPR